MNLTGTQSVSSAVMSLFGTNSLTSAVMSLTGTNNIANLLLSLTGFRKLIYFISLPLTSLPWSKIKPKEIYNFERMQIKF